MDARVDEVQLLLEKGRVQERAGQGTREETFLDVLDYLLKEFGCVVGTVHELDPKSGMLELRANRGIPPPLMDKVATIPIGKGMAGIAAERRAPVQVCNLQTDESGVAKPSAKETRMEGSISFPIIHDGEVLGAMGIAKPVTYEFTEGESAALMEIGSRVGRYIKTGHAGGSLV